MLGNTLLLVLFLGFSAFMLNRLYVGVRDKQLNVKGWVYSQEDTPFRFRFSILMACVGAIFGLLMMVVMAAGVFGLFSY
jgi:hypothetical protein